MGYNETVGYRAGTTQAYKPLEASRLLELPLHVMDTALFYPAYLGLSPARRGRSSAGWWRMLSSLGDASRSTGMTGALLRRGCGTGVSRPASGAEEPGRVVCNGRASVFVVSKTSVGSVREAIHRDREAVRAQSGG